MDLPVDRNFKLQVNLIYERHIYVYEVCFAREEMFECLNVFACRFTRLQLKVEMLHLDPICCGQSGIGYISLFLGKLSKYVCMCHCALTKDTD